MKKELEIYVDGACSGNPGEAGIGVVIFESGEKIREISKPIGRATNNIAEYTAIICGIKEASALNGTDIKIFTDSQLAFSQIAGTYKISNEILKALHDQISELIKNFDHVDIQHIPREQNKDADKLATQSIKQKQAKVVASTFRLK